MIITITNDNGATLVISSGRVANALMAVDFGAIDEETYTSAPTNTHGSIYDGCRLSERDITVTVCLNGGVKANVLKALSPLSEASFATNGRTARGKIIGSPVFTYKEPITYTFVFRMFSPWFTGDERLVEITGTANITNPGDFPTPCIVGLYGANRTAGDQTFGVVPCITYGNSKMQLEFTSAWRDQEYSLKSGYNLKAETDMLKRTAVIEWANCTQPVNAFPFLTPESRFFYITPGESSAQITIMYQGATVAENGSGFIKFKPRYMEAV